MAVHGGFIYASYHFITHDVVHCSGINYNKTNPRRARIHDIDWSIYYRKIHEEYHTIGEDKAKGFFVLIFTIIHESPMELFDMEDSQHCDFLSILERIPRYSPETLGFRFHKKGGKYVCRTKFDGSDFIPFRKLGTYLNKATAKIRKDFTEFSGIVLDDLLTADTDTDSD